MSSCEALEVVGLTAMDASTWKHLRRKVADINTKYVNVAGPLIEKLIAIENRRNPAAMSNLSSKEEEYLGRIRSSVTQGMVEDRTLRCAFCGQAYAEGTPTHRHEALTAHVRECPEHPLGKELRQVEEDCSLLCQYVTHNGPMCDEGCPGDDTCSWSAKEIHDAVNRLCRRATAKNRPTLGKTPNPQPGA